MKLAHIYSAIGHALMHMYAAFYAVIVLTIEKDWQTSYSELLQLWILGALLIGLVAIPAGWISDRWSRSGMILIMFLGLGISSLICGLSYNKTTLFIGLTFLGIFCAIYHPVAIAWVVNISKKKGLALGINGIFGVVGVGLGGVIAGVLVASWNWQMAFIAPSIITIIIGLTLLYHILIGKISLTNTTTIKTTTTDNQKSQLIKIALIMLVSIFCLGLIFQTIQTSTPKLLEIRLAEKLGLEISSIGFLITFIYVIAGAGSIFGGLAADKYSLKKIYLLGIILQSVFLFFVATSTNISLIFLLLLTVISYSAILPAENMLLASYVSQKHHGLIYGFKFIFVFSSAPVAIFLVSKFYEIYKEFTYLYLFVGALLLGVLILVFFLPFKSKVSEAEPAK